MGLSILVLGLHINHSGVEIPPNSFVSYLNYIVVNIWKSPVFVSKLPVLCCDRYSKVVDTFLNFDLEGGDVKLFLQDVQ